MSNEVKEVVNVVEETVVDEMKGTNGVRIAEDVGLVAVGALAVYGAVKLLAKPVKKAVKWISSKFSKKNNTEDTTEQQTQDENK